MKTHARLPLTFNAEKLQKELQTASEKWIRHFNTDYFEGDWSGIVLRGSTDEFYELAAGNPESDNFVDFDIMEKLPYTRSVLDTIKTEKLSIRYLRLKPGSIIKAHQDYDLVYWDGLVRLHIPIITNNNVVFTVDNQRVLMNPGECWFADFSKTHSVENNGRTDRVHLVIDCKVNDWLEQLFIKEEIVQKGKKAPDPIVGFPEESKIEMIRALREIGTETSLQIASEMENKFHLSAKG